MSALAPSRPVPNPGTAGPDEIVRGLVGRLPGPVLEIGPGAAPSTRWLGPGVRWTGVEPDPVRRAAGTRLLRPGDRLVAGVAEHLVVPDGSFGAVVGIRVLCSVRDPFAALGEIRRVLAPGGRYVFVEHVAAPRGSWRRYAQKAWSAASRWSHECRPDRDTTDLIVSAGFDHVEYTSYTDSGPFGLGTDVVVGTATITRFAPSAGW